MARINKKPIISYIANSGLFIQYKEKKIVIDGVHVENVKPYLPVNDKILEAMVMGKEPYDKIDILMFTHHHLEHFDAFTVCEILKRNRYTQLVGTKAVNELIQKSSNYDPVIQAQIKVISLDVGKSITMVLKDIPFEIISLKHDGKNYSNVENYAYFFELGGRTFLHVGDAMPLYEDYKEFDIFERIIDVLIIPFPYVGLTAGRKIIKSIEPKQLIVVHLPDKKQDTQNWIKNTLKVYGRYERELPPTTFLMKPQEEIIIK